MATLTQTPAKRNTKKAALKIYKLICKDFGHKFSFNAKDERDAEMKKNGWCRYHSFDNRDFKVEETTEAKWMHNEYID